MWTSRGLGLGWDSWERRGVSFGLGDWKAAWEESLFAKEDVCLHSVLGILYMYLYLHKC